MFSPLFVIVANGPGSTTAEATRLRVGVKEIEEDDCFWYPGRIITNYWLTYRPRFLRPDRFCKIVSGSYKISRNLRFLWNSGD